MSSNTVEMPKRHLAKGDALPPVDESHMRLYIMRFCPYAHRTKIVLEHKKIPHEMVFVNLKNKPDWLFERNPLGLVPVLEHKGKVVYESAVCDEFLEEAFPGSSTGTHALMPQCSYERAEMRLLMLKFDKVFQTAFGLVLEGDPAKRPQLLSTLHSILAELEQLLTTTDKPFFGGWKYGMADLHGYPIFERFPAVNKLGMEVLPAENFPRLTAWTSAMQQQDCVKKWWISPQTHYNYILRYRPDSPSPDYDMEMDAETVAVQKSVVA